MSAAERDRYTDATRDGSGQTTKDEVGFFIDPKPWTLAEEIREHGWNSNTRPTGAKRPQDEVTSGGR